MILVGIGDSGYHARHPGRGQGAHAWPLTALAGAGRQGDIGGSARRIATVGAALGNGINLGVRLAVDRGAALAEDDAIPHQDATDARIGPGPTQAQAA